MTIISDLRGDDFSIGTFTGSITEKAGVSFLDLLAWVLSLPDGFSGSLKKPGETVNSNQLLVNSKQLTNTQITN